MPDEFESWQRASGSRPERERSGFVPRASSVKQYGGQSRANPYAEEARKERKLFYIVIGSVILLVALGVFLFAVNSGGDDETVHSGPAEKKVPAAPPPETDPLGASGWK